MSVLTKLKTLVGQGHRLSTTPRSQQLSKGLQLLKNGSYGELFEKVKLRLRTHREWVESEEKMRKRFAPVPSDREAAGDLARREFELALDTLLASETDLVFQLETQPRVSVIIALHGDPAPALASLRSLQRLSVPLEVVLVDDEPSDRSRALLDRIKGVRVVRGDDAVYQQAADDARSVHLLLLESGAIALSGSLEAALRILERSTNVGAVCGPVVHPGGQLEEAGAMVCSDGTVAGYGRGDNPELPEYMFEREVDCCSGVFLLTRRDTFQECFSGNDYVGESYSMVDYCLAIRESGRCVLYSPWTAVTYAGVPAVDPASMAADRRRLKHRHASFVSQQPASGSKRPRAERSGTEKTRVLFIEDRAPHPHLGMGYPRSAEMLRIIRDLGYEVTLLPTLVPDESWPSVYSGVPATVEVMLGFGKDRIEEFLATRVGYYDVIIISRPHNMKPFAEAQRRHPKWFDGVRIIYDAEALFCLRRQVFQELLGQPWSREKVQKELESEIALARGAHVVLSVSSSEREEFLRRGMTDSRLLIHCVDVEPGATPFDARRDILFMGSMHGHPTPNSDAIIWFAREAFPLVQSALGSEVRLLIAGTIKAREVEALASDAIELLGVVPDLGPLFDRCRIFVAPTRYSAGVPIKVCEASAHGIPSVTSELVASQLGWQDGDALLSAPAGDATAFASQCVSLYCDERLWRQIRSNAISRVSVQCSKQAFTETLRSAIAIPP
jgi:glycosyltransferase involved in cell wall biosynthesis